MTDRCDIVAAGHICIDIIPGITGVTPEQWGQLFQPGKLVSVGALTFSTGGPVSNTGLSLHRLGMNTRLMGKVGDDLLGGALRQLVAGVAPSLADGMVVDGEAEHGILDALGAVVAETDLQLIPREIDGFD